MITIFYFFASAWGGGGDPASAPSANAQKSANVRTSVNDQESKTVPLSASPQALSERERLFQETLKGAVLKGQYRMARASDGKQPLSAPVDEQYVISDVSKVLEDSWMITARIRYGDRDVTAPVVVRVAWAGDTPVIMMDSAPIPLLGTYSARVMIHGGFYSGTWFGENYGGVLSGQVLKLSDAQEPVGSASKPSEASDSSGATLRG